MNSFIGNGSVWGINMATVAKYSDWTLEELREKKQKYLNFMKFIDAEIERKTKTKADSKPNAKEKGDTRERKSVISLATRTDMMKILAKNKIDYKMSMSKAELLLLVRNNNLVRTVENEYRSRVDADTKS